MLYVPDFVAKFMMSRSMGRELSVALFCLFICRLSLLLFLVTENVATKIPKKSTEKIANKTICSTRRSKHTSPGIGRSSRVFEGNRTVCGDVADKNEFNIFASSTLILTVQPAKCSEAIGIRLPV